MPTTVSQDFKYYYSKIPSWLKKLTLFIIFIYLVFIVIYYQKNPLGTDVIINGKAFKVDVAATVEEKHLGLGGRAKMNEDEGMIFPFNAYGTHGFWMKGMKFDLDFIWIKDKVVAEVTSNVPAPIGDNQPVHVSPKIPVNIVMEVNAGTVQKYNIKAGDTVDFRTE